MSNIYNALAYGKINLHLDVLDKMENGYHNIESVMQSVSLADEITLEISNINTDENLIEVISSNSKIPTDKTNLVYKCADKFLRTTGISGKHCLFSIEKNIPVAAGMAGGSSDGATALKLINEACGNLLSHNELYKLGATIGADIPFCLTGGTCICKGIGDDITQIKRLKNVYLVSAIDFSSVSTPYAFSLLDNAYGTNMISPKGLTDIVKAIENENVKDVASFLYNKFEDVIIPLNQNVRKIKDIMLRCGALGALMSGSGPSVFGIFLDEISQKNALNELKNCSINAFLCKTI